MNNRTFLLFILLALLQAAPATAAAPANTERADHAPEATSDKSPTDPTQENATQASPKNGINSWLGLTYFSYFNGPGIQDDTVRFCPNSLGLPSNDGINIQNHVSFRFKFSERLALDFQSRFYLILNNYTHNPKFSAFRWETPRIGISGKLLHGEEWDLTGAINTDFPYFFPTPLSGYQVQQRKALINPGMFAKFHWEPKNSRWSVFSVIMPRFFIYADRTVAEPQLTYAGSVPGNKPELIIALMPTLNYQVSRRWKLTIGTTLDYRKHILSDWNPFQVSLLTNGEDPAWRLSPVPIALGASHKISEALSIFPFITAYPIAIQRVNAHTGQQATLLESASVGMWLFGTVL